MTLSLGKKVLSILRDTERFRGKKWNPIFCRSENEFVKLYVPLHR